MSYQDAVCSAGPGAFQEAEVRAAAVPAEWVPESGLQNVHQQFFLSIAQGRRFQQW